MAEIIKSVPELDEITVLSPDDILLIHTKDTNGNDVSRKIKASNVGPGKFGGIIARNVSGQSVANNSPVRVNYATTIISNHAEIIPATPTRIFFRKSGYWSITRYVSFSANATGVRTSFLEINGGTAVSSSGMNTNATGGSGTTDHQVTTYGYFNSGDYIEVVVLQTSGATLTLNATGISTNSIVAEFIGI